MVKMAGSNQGASSAYTEAGPPEMMIALKEGEKKNTSKCFNTFISNEKSNKRVKHTHTHAHL